MLDLEPVELRQDGSVGTGMVFFAAHAGAGAATKMYREFDSAEAFHHRIDHVDRKVGRPIRIVVALPYIRIDEKAKMRIVDLHDVDAARADQFDLASQRR